MLLFVVDSPNPAGVATVAMAWCYFKSASPFFHVALPPLLCYLGGEAEDHFARDRASTEVGVGVVVGVGISNAFGSGLMTIEPGPAAPPAADADCGTLPPKPQPAAAAADPNAMKENEEAGANLLL